jgi:hypothetical protein
MFEKLVNKMTNISRNMGAPLSLNKAKLEQCTGQVSQLMQMVLGFDRQLIMLKDMIMKLSQNIKDKEIKIAKSENEDDKIIKAKNKGIKG